MEKTSKLSGKASVFQYWAGGYVNLALKIHKLRHLSVRESNTATKISFILSLYASHSSSLPPKTLFRLQGQYWATFVLPCWLPFCVEEVNLSISGRLPLVQLCFAIFDAGRVSHVNLHFVALRAKKISVYLRALRRNRWGRYCHRNRLLIAPMLRKRLLY